MLATDFGVRPGARRLAPLLAELIHDAALRRSVLMLEPGEYHLEEPVVVEFRENIVRSWGVSAVGVAFIAEYMSDDPVLLLDVVEKVSVRFMMLDGLTLRGKNAGPGLHIRRIGGGGYFYSFQLSRISAENCDDAIRLEGNVFEGEVTGCYGRDSNCGLALGNDENQGGVLSAINVFGGSYSFNRVDGMRTFGPQYREPYDFSVYGSYCGNNGRYSINAAAGATLIKGARLENPWNDTATHDPDNTKARAAIKMANFANIEQTNTGGNNGKVTTLVDGYLSGTLQLRDCKTPQVLAKLNGQAGNSFCRSSNCKGEIDATSAVVVTRD